MADGKASCVVFGAGALGLGFLGPELSADCAVTFVDVPAKADLIGHLHRAGSYVFNQTGLSMRGITVSGVDALCMDPEGGGEAVAAALDGADLILTAVGEANLPRLAPVLAAAAGRRSPDLPLRVLCAENGVDIARGLQAAIGREAGGVPGDRLLVGDTVMGRMCKIVTAPEPPVAPVAPDMDWAVVAEPFFGIPVAEHAVAGMKRVPGALQPQGERAFAASEDVKMLSHNGLHVVLACLGWLRGRRHFAELRGEADLMELARRLLVEEAGAALLKKHAGALDRSDYLNYCDSVLRRITCPVLNDSVERGVRGILRKLEPRERLVYSLRTVWEQDITPTSYATGLAAAILVARQSGQTGLAFGDLLHARCGLDAELISLVEGQRQAADAPG